MNAEALVAVLVLAAPGALAYMARHTWGWWLASAVLAVLAIVCFSSLQPVHSGEMFADLGNSILEIAGGFLLVYAAVILIVIGGIRAHHARRPARPQLPPARLL